MKFRDNLLYQRQQRNMTQEQLAMLLGVSRQSVAKWEAGQSTPEVDKLMKMAELFDCSLDELVKGDLTQVVVAPEQVLPTDAPPQDICGYDEHLNKFAWRIAVGVGLIILGVAAMVLLTTTAINEELTVIAVLVGVVAGLVFIIPAGIEHAAFAKAHPFVEDFYTEAQKAQVRRWFTWNLVLGIGLIFAGIIVVIVLGTVGNDDVAVGIMLALVAAGVFCIVRSGIRFGLTDVDNYNRERENEKWERENPQCDRICGIIMLIATALGLLMLFGGWAAANEGVPHAGVLVGFFWVVWPIGGILCAIVTTAMRGANK